MSTFAVPPSQNTAPVLEFRCLYTHDQRQKQKRWQDGTLKYHTFNKRIMVYDESMNYVSDAHSKNDTLQDGDELRLQNGVLVEVSEAIRISHTDLTALLQRRQKPAVEQGHEQSQEQRIGNIGRLSTATRTILGGRTNPGTAPRPKHKSLNALLGTGHGALGKAALQQSPYETRHGTAGLEAENGPACKRQKKHPPEPRLWPVTANTKSSARPAPNQSVPQRERPLGAHRGKPPGTTKKTPKSHSVIAEQTSLTMKEVVDITSDDDCTLQSDLTFSDLSPSKPRSPERVSLRNECDGMIGRLPHATSHVRASPPANPVYQLQNADRRSRSGKSPTAPQKPSAPVERNPRAKALQLSKAKSKPKLLCMNNINLTEMQTSSRRRLHEPSTIPSDREANLAKPAKTSQKPPRRISSANRIINKDANLSPSSLPQRTLSSTVQGGSGEQSRGPRILKAPVPSPPNRAAANSTTALLQSIPNSPTSTERELHEMALAYGRMDQQLLQPRSDQIQPSRPPGQPSAARHFRRIQSENSTRSLTRPPTSAATSATIVPPARIQTTPRSKQPLRRVHSVAPTSRPCTTGPLPSFVQPMKPPPKQPTIRDVGPWSTEAFDLFDWCPPDWEERVRRIPASVLMVD